jgi:hypothetical protein
MTKEQAHAEIWELFAVHGAEGDVSHNQSDLINKRLTEILDDLLDDSPEEESDPREVGTYKNARIHPDWDWDGLEGMEGPDEMLWRMDLQGDFQIQLFAKVRDGAEDVPQYTGHYRLFIEHDVRNEAGDRVKYSCDDWDIQEPEFVKLLESAGPSVAVQLGDTMYHVSTLPNDPKMCR